jgi:hypothetical protein
MFRSLRQCYRIDKGNDGVDGTYTPGNRSVFYIAASLQPSTPDELKIIDEGLRTNESYTLYYETNNPLRTIETSVVGNPDIVIYDNEEYECIGTGKWRNKVINHYMSIIQKTKSAAPINEGDAIELLTIARNSLDTFDTLIDDINIIVDDAIAATTQEERDALYPIFVDKLDEIDQLCLSTKWRGYQIWPAPLAEGKKSLTTSIYNQDYLGKDVIDKRNYISKRLYSDTNNTNRAELAPLGENDPSSVLFFNIPFGQLTQIDIDAYLPHRESYIPFVPNIMTVAFTQMDSNGLFVVNPFGSLYGGVRDMFSNFDFDTAILTDALIGFYKTNIWLDGSIADKLELLKYIVNNDEYALRVTFGIINNLNMYAQLGNIDCPGTGKGRVIKQREYIDTYLNILNNKEITK